MGRERLENARRQAVGLQVEQPQPDGPQSPQIAQQALEAAVAGDLPAARVLADQHELAGARLESVGRGREDRGGRHRLVGALDQRDGAERAAPVAAVGDLQVGVGRAAARARSARGAARPLAGAAIAPRRASSSSTGPTSKAENTSTSGSAARSSAS